MASRVNLLLWFGLSFFLLPCLDACGQGLIVHYDPNTGGVALDTRQIPGGTLVNYSFDLADRTHTSTAPEICRPFADPADGVFCQRPAFPEILFRPENHVRLTSNAFYGSFPLSIGETSFSGPLSGVFSLGEILPPNLNEATWGSLFNRSPGGGHQVYDYGGHYYYVAALGGGSPPDATFVYGFPEVEFDNRFDLIDPDTLDFAESATLKYRQSTGELIFDSSEGFSTGILLSGTFLAENFVNPFPSTINAASDTSILVLTDVIEPGEYSLGSLLPAGLSETEFVSVITNTSFFGRPGFGADMLVLETEGTEMELAFVASTASCDLDGDGDCDLADINSLSDLEDIQSWLTAASINMGDLDFNGVVNSADLGVLVNNIGDPTKTSWSQGNIDGVAGVDSKDLGLILNQMKRNAASGSAVAVPEAHGWLLMSLSFLAIPTIRRR